MKILLLGEYSNVHSTLARGLKTLGHKVTVASNGDFWKNYPRDISLVREYTRWGGIKYSAKLLANLPRMCGYDVVQLINPMFLELKAERIFSIYDFLRKHNKHMFLGAFGMDYYLVHTNTFEKPLEYSDFNFGDKLRTNADAVKEQRDWLGTAKEKLNKYIANDCDGIVTGLYEYDICYRPVFPNKTHFIPFPIECPDVDMNFKKPEKVKIFIGIQKSRSEYKGTDIMYAAAKDVLAKHPDKMELLKAENVPFDEYCRMMNGSDAILDQLYSYTPSMNPLLGMSKGLICIGGGEQGNYDIINETKLRPIINVKPTYESVYYELEELVLHPERIPQLKRESIEYVRKHHDIMKVAKKYEHMYMNTK